MKKIIIAVLGLLLLLSLATPSYAKKDTVTYTLKVKSTGSDVNVREKPTTKSKILGKLKKGQTLAMRYENYGTGFYEVVYKGKKAYVSMDYAKEVKPNQRWIGSYYNSSYSGTGISTKLYVYKKTSNNIYFLSRTGYRYDPTNGDLAGYEMPWKFSNYYGSAKITSSTSASFSSKSCKATFKSVGNTIRVTEKSKAGSCTSTGLEMYYGDGDSHSGEYEK